jgi:hypothetical protein
MACGEGVIGAFTHAGKATEPAVLAQGVEAISAPREEFVGIGLVAHIPHDFVSRKIKHIVQRYGQFHGPEAGGEMSPSVGDCFNNHVADFLCQLWQARSIQSFEILRRINLFEIPHCNLTYLFLSMT